MVSRNLRHFRLFLAVADSGSPTLAAARCNLSQPAVTQAVAKLEREVGGALFDRTRQGLALTDRGRVLDSRLRRAMDRLDAALAEVANRLTLTATTAQLQAVIALAETQNSSLAARQLGLAQPTVHRAVTHVEGDAGKPLFQRTPHGMIATRACRQIARAAQLAFSEFDQAEADLAEFDGRDAGRIVIGCLPLSRSVILPEALARFRQARPKLQVTLHDGPYMDMLRGLRRGEIDVIIGALRQPAPVDDVIQEQLFADRLACIARPGHPLTAETDIPLDVLAQHAWVVPRQGTPTREQFDELFASHGLDLPDSIVECGSILLMREVLARSELIGCISARQAAAEVDKGLVARLHTRIASPARAIGLTYRRGWVPTKAQSLMLDLLRDAAAAAPPV